MARAAPPMLQHFCYELNTKETCTTQGVVNSDGPQDNTGQPHKHGQMAREETWVHELC